MKKESQLKLHWTQLQNKNTSELQKNNKSKIKLNEPL